MRREKLILLAVLAPIAAALILYSQTGAFVWDEGFHLLAASLIAAGKRPYIDFCFPQTPLNAYWNAGLMHIFGEHWGAPHLFAALFLVASAALAADFLLTRFPVQNWRLACAACVAVFVGCNRIVMQFGPIAQAYAICMLLGTAAFRAAVAAVAGTSIVLAAIAGLLAGAAAGSSLLTAPAVPILLLWICIYNRAGSRIAKAVAFSGGALIPFTPVFWLYLEAPRQTLFNIVQYQALFRRVDWPGATLQDITALSAWITSTQGLLLVLLATAGLLAAYRQFQPASRAEFYLTAWLTVGMGLFIATAHPTFQRYFIVLVPFPCILAAAGLWSVGTRLGNAARPLAPALLAIGLTVLPFARQWLIEDREDTTWQDYGKIAAKVAEVTPPQDRLYADEPVYFILQRRAPQGMEFSYSHKLLLPPNQEALLHIVSEGELKQQFQQGKFATVQTCKDDFIDKNQLPALFPNRADMQDCSIFWGKVKTLK